MTLSRRSSSWALVVCGLALVSGHAPGVSARSTASKTSCEALRSWARPYAGSQPTLGELARFDRPRRLATFTAIAPEARAALWREQLGRFSRPPQLSDAQRALVHEGVALATPALYAGDKAAAAALAAFWQRAGGAFSRDQRAQWFLLGGPSTSTATTQDFCGCSSAWEWLECESGSCPSAYCEPWLGCGLNGGSVCNGYCTAP